MIRLGPKKWKRITKFHPMRGLHKQTLRFVVYLIKTATPNHYYVGQTTNLKVRMLQHLGVRIGVHKGARFVKEHGVEKIDILCETDDQQEALRRESFYFHRLSFEDSNKVVSMGL